MCDGQVFVATDFLLTHHYRAVLAWGPPRRHQGIFGKETLSEVERPVTDGFGVVKRGPLPIMPDDQPRPRPPVE
jgi:hypothetical protein